MARPYPSNTNLPEGKLEIEKAQTGEFIVFFTPPKSEVSNSTQAPEDYKRRIMDIDARKQLLVLYPYRGWSTETMRPRYYQLGRITIETSLPETFIPKEIEDIEGMLEMELPTVFTKDYRFGLGFRKEYRHIVNWLEFIDVKHLYLKHFELTQIHLERREAIIKLSDLEMMARCLDRITDKARYVAHNLKHKKVAELFADILSQQTPINKTAGLRSEIAGLIGDSNRFIPGGATKKEEKEALDVVRVNSRKIQKDHPEELVKLRNDIETVTLEDLISRFKIMLEKDLNETHWQRMLEENPFILTMAFGTPVIKIQGQAYVGGRKISGLGEKIADFLFKNSATNNATIIEIKKPKTDLLLSRPYRTQVFTPSSELVASVNQVLDQIYQFQKNIAQIKESSRIINLETYSVTGVLIIGRSLSKIDHQKSFELYRGNSKSIQIVTFDELLDKLETLLQFLNPESKAISNQSTNSEQDSDELPF